MESDRATAPMVTASPDSLTPVADVKIQVPEDEDVLGSLENQKGIGSIGPLEVTKPSLVIFAACAGQGHVSVGIPGVGSFPLKCDSNASGVRNEFDVGHVSGPITVKIAGMGEQRWAVTVAQAEPTGY
ncbi:hypothetical protein [Arthrobacter roseus]|uniref:hypothetical protein n=1 Tax=Arthrobacter roseus TaxID=136274 RepID=UPI001962AE6F|nr:hypothetical protein [Arthrobacter roseus]MBM7849282.1 hypothetical protein [Arthrobacter roseus]